MTFCSLESRSPIKNVIKHHVQVFFKENDTHKKFQIFVETYGKNEHCPTLLRWYFCSQESLFPIKNIIKHHVQVFFKEKETQTKFQISGEHHELMPLEK